jgi:hypothetical protein
LLPGVVRLLLAAKLAASPVRQVDDFSTCTADLRSKVETIDERTMGWWAIIMPYERL